MISLFSCVAKLGVGVVERSLSKSFPMHQRTLDFIERIKSYDHLKLLVRIRQFLVTVFQ